MCIDTDWQNELLLPLEFNLPKNKVLNGLESQFDSDKRLVILKLDGILGGYSLHIDLLQPPLGDGGCSG